MSDDEGVPQVPPWLLAMEHAALGEARAKAFLLDRFWVLERSVDIHGADLLVQLRESHTSTLDRSNSRVGFIQAKFIQDERTAIVIPSAHVRDDNGSPHDEFFMLVSTGAEDTKRLFLLSAAEICDRFTEKGPPEKPALRIPGRVLLSNSNFEVGSKRVALDRIEHALRGASLLSNRRYLRNLGTLNVSSEQIDVDYASPLQNWWGDIPKAFYEQRVEARKVLYELEEAADAIDELLQVTDPVVAGRIYDKRLKRMVGASGSLTFDIRGILNPDLTQVAQEQKLHLDRIRARGIEGAYFRILAAFDDEALRFARDQNYPVSGAVHVEITYRSSDLRNVSIIMTKHAVRCSGALLYGYASVVHSDAGTHSICYDAAHALPDTDWTDAKRDPAMLHLPFQMALDRQLLGLETEDGYFS
jgi:hypothetical protein